MKDYALISLKDSYDNIYSRPNNDSDAISILIDVYKEKMGNITPSIKDGIGEIYRELLSKGLPSYYWMLEAIYRTSKKAESKRSFNYIVGTLRNWSLYGFGNTSTDDEDEIYNYFEETIRFDISPESRVLISSLVGTFGALKVMRSIHELSSVDASKFFAETLGKIMVEKYSPNINPNTTGLLNRSSTQQKSPSAYVGSRKPQRNKKNFRRGIDDFTNETIEYLKSQNEPSRPVDIANYLVQEKGFNENLPRSITSRLLYAMKKTDLIVKEGTGKYRYRENVFYGN